MIRVIDTTPNPTIIKRCSCRNCGCTLEYTPNDVVKDYRTDYTGCTDEYNTVRCPQCSKNINV